MNDIRRPKILSQEILSDRFSKLFEYRLQFPSIRNADGYAAEIKREVLRTTNSVVVLIYARQDDAFILVEEYRTGVALNESGDDPLLLQCVAGMIDKTKAPEDIARMEAKEEAGIVLDTLTLVGTVYNSPGRMTEKTHIFFAEIEKAPEEGIFGLAEEGEEMRTRIISRAEIFSRMDQRKILDSMTLSALNWFRAGRH